VDSAKTLAVWAFSRVRPTGGSAKFLGTFLRGRASTAGQRKPDIRCKLQFMGLGLIQRLPGWVARIGSDPADSSEIALQKRLVLALTLGPAPAGITWGAVYYWAGAEFAGLIPSLYTPVAIANTALFAATRNLRLYRSSQLLMILLLPWLLMMSLGGFKDSSAVVIWSALAPLTALIVDELRRAIFWLLAFLGLLAVSGLVQPYLPTEPLPEPLTTWLFVLNIGAVIACVFAILYYFVLQRNFFQEQSEMLLLNILPKEISEALKAGQQTIAADYDSASILFADVVNFTPMAATMTPLKLVDLLNEVFECFDELVDKYGLEKIKTIGDCYMVAAGVPRPRHDHAKALVQLALDMQIAVAERKFGGRRLAFRIGINSGPVVAGVIGRKKFSYDLWGAAVNIASRMETYGQSGTIQITRETYELVKNDFVLEAKGTVNVRGAGELEIWHALGRKPG
jgi:adenylate cyclase